MLYALFFERCNHEFQTKERFGLAALIGLIAGVVSAFVKWGAEFPLPPRSPMDMFNAACGPESAIRAAEAIDCSRNFLNPPYVFLRDYMGIADPNAAIYEFAGHAFNYVMFTHIIFFDRFCGSLLRCCGEISENHALARRCSRYFSQYRRSRYYFAYSWSYAAALDATLV